MALHEHDIASKYPKSTRSDIDQATGAALHQYVHLETQLDIIFEFAVGARKKGIINHQRALVASYAFAKIFNPDTKLQVIGMCLDTYLTDISPQFKKSLLKEYKALTAIRNQIAHGIVNISKFDNVERHCLVKPRGGIDKYSLFPEDLRDFITRARFSFYLITIVRDKLLGQDSKWLKADNRDVVFEEKVVYPPPNTHPIASIWNGPTTPA
ncbi:hypothetical protein [Sulfitobacter sp. MF3-043]|uniref:hypothetical protein n=1 Tax=Sulfitobacter sediminivivens TaxID=3252902 RepID=UPI0036DEDCD8